MWAAPVQGFHQPGWAWERTKASLAYKHRAAVSSCSLGCAPQPYSLVIFTVSLPKTKWEFCCLGRRCFLDGITGVEIPAECSSHGSRRKRAFNPLIVFRAFRGFVNSGSLSGPRRWRHWRAAGMNDVRGRHLPVTQPWGNASMVSAEKGAGLVLQCLAQ